jgi:hypothetical protein
VPNIRFRGGTSILQRDCVATNISVSSINILLRVIELHENKDSYSAIYERVEGILMCSIFNLEAGR